MLALAGCAVNPFTGRPALVLTSLEHERRAGEQAAATLGEQVGHAHAPETVAYVRAIGQRVAAGLAETDFSFQFHVLDTAQPNAVALPGGNIYVTRGLLVLLNSEDELAAVLGHEIVHVAARHAARSRARRVPLSVIAGMGRLAGNIINPRIGDAVGGAGDMASGLVLAPYSRDDEREADEYGQALAAKAGYDPAALGAFLRTLGREAQLSARPQQERGFSASHPLIPERIEASTEHAQLLVRGASGYLAPDRAAFYKRIEGLTVGDSAASGRFVGHAFVHPDLGFRLRFPERWIMHNAQLFVAAQAPDGSALVALEHVGSGTDPMLGVRAFEESTGLTFDPAPVRRAIGNLEAARASTVIVDGRSDAAVDLTWIIHEGSIYRITCVAGRTDAERYRTTFDMITASFRELSAGERAAIRETRLRTTLPRPGEDLAQLGRRTGTVWSLAELAALNDLDAKSPLVATVPVKIALEEPY